MGKGPMEPRACGTCVCVACRAGADRGGAVVQDTQLGAAVGGPGAARAAGQAAADGREGLLRLHREGG